MLLIPEIDSLIDADKLNTPKVKQFLFNFSQEILDTINQTSVLYKTALRIIELNQNKFNALVKNTSSDPNPKQISNKDVKTPEKIYSYHNRIVLLLRIGILYTYGITDLLRMRITGPIGYLRVQCESLALMKLINDDLKVAYEWMNIKSEKDGKQFFKQYQKKVKSILDSFNLKDTYNNSSGFALHSRLAGISPGLKIDTDNKIIFELKAQEFDDKNPHKFLIIVLHILRTQERILSNLHKANPEIDDKLFIETRIPRFKESVDRLFKEFVKKYPKVIQKYKHILTDK